MAIEGEKRVRDEKLPTRDEKEDPTVLKLVIKASQTEGVEAGQGLWIHHGILTHCAIREVSH